MSNLAKIYISGPITKGDQEHNFSQAAVAQHHLMKLGAAPLNPMLSMKLPSHDQHSHETWIATDLAWVKHADAVYRLPGESVGADQETAFAEARNIPVFHSLDKLEQFIANHKQKQAREFIPVIGLHGYPGAGKDAAAKVLLDAGWARVSFADPVREGLLALNPWICLRAASLRAPAKFMKLKTLVAKIGWTLAKKFTDVREGLQKYGTEAGREIHHQDCWLAIARREINRQMFCEKAKGIIITDVRFPNEVRLVVNEFNGMIVEIQRPGVGPVNSHKSEMKIDVNGGTIVNDGTVEQLHMKLLAHVAAKLFCNRAASSPASASRPSPLVILDEAYGMPEYAFCRCELLAAPISAAAWSKKLPSN